MLLVIIDIICHMLHIIIDIICHMLHIVIDIICHMLHIIIDILCYYSRGSHFTVIIAISNKFAKYIDLQDIPIVFYLFNTIIICILDTTVIILKMSRAIRN